MEQNRNWYKQGTELLHELKNTCVPEGFSALWYLGQAGFALKTGDTLCFFDPVLADLTAGDGSTRRYYPAPFTPEEAAISGVSYVFCTHDHADHLQPGTVGPLAKAASSVKIVVPAPYVAKVIGLGAVPEQVIGAKAEEPIALPDGSVKRVTVQPGLDSALDAGDARIITLAWDQARFARRLDGELFVGDGVNLYSLHGELFAIEDGSFACWRYTENGFERMEITRDFHPAQLTLEPVDEPFTPPHAYELELGGKRARWWQRVRVTTGEGFVTIPGEYDVAQIYADGKLVADNFYTGIDWRVPASLLHDRECYLVMSELKDDFYREA